MGTRGSLAVRSTVILALAIMTGFPGVVFPVLGQESAAQTLPSSEPVILRVTVRDKKGKLVDNMTESDFRVVENGKAQQLILFSQAEPQPLTLGLLMQWSGQRRDALPYGELDVASRFLQSLMRPSDRAFAAGFTSTVTVFSDLSDNPSEIATRLRTAAGKELYGPKALHDAIIWACQEKLSPRSGRRILLVVADGQDNSSKWALSAAIEVALRTDTAIYFVSLVLANPFITRDQRSTVPTLKRLAENLAERTGGDVVFVTKQSEMEAAFTLILQELRGQYTLAYRSTNVAQDGKFRKVKIQSTRKGLSIHSRSGYYALENQGRE